MDYKNTRGHRNNNPLNIRRTNDKWQGMSKNQIDKDFVVFDSLVYGFRAAFRIIHNGFKTSPKRDSLKSIITRWAPPNENDTKRYINFVSAFVGVPPSATLNYDDEHLMISVVRAMAYMETGNWYSFSDIDSGYQLEKT